MLDRTPSFILDPDSHRSAAAAGGSPAGAPDGALLDAFSTAVTDVVDRIGPSVVKVEAKPDAKSRGPGGHGSGVVISPDGLALTNSHVVGGAREMRLTTPDGRILEAQVLGDDPDTDLAVLRAADARALPFAPARRFEASQARAAGRRDRQPARLRVDGHGGRGLGAGPQPPRTHGPPHRRRHPDRRRAQSRQFGRAAAVVRAAR